MTLLVYYGAWLSWVLQISILSFAHSLSAGHSSQAIPIAKTNIVSCRNDPNLAKTSYPFFSDVTEPIDTFILPFTSSASNHSTQSSSKGNVYSRNPSTADQVSSKGLRLMSSTRNLTGVDGYILYASPILSTELIALLLATHDDLSVHRDGNDGTNFYQYNHTAWSFQVAVFNRTLHYASISSVVTRFLRLVSGQSEATITWTRVGCVYDGDEPIADVAILPTITDQETTYTGFNTIDSPLNSGKPVQIMTISPTGIYNSTEIINPGALDIYRIYLAHDIPKRALSTTSIEREIILKVFDTGYYLTLAILRNPAGMPARALVVFLTAAVWLGLCRFAMRFLLGLTAGFLFDPQVADRVAEIYEIDGGSYRLGRLSARLIMEATARDHNGKLIGFKPDDLKAFAEALLAPLQKADKGEEIYAVGGKILGLDSVNGTARMVTLGHWKLNVEPAPATVHDEL